MNNKKSIIIIIEEKKYKNKIQKRRSTFAAKCAGERNDFVLNDVTHSGF